MRKLPLRPFFVLVASIFSMNFAYGDHGRFNGGVAWRPDSCEGDGQSFQDDGDRPAHTGYLVLIHPDATVAAPAGLSPATLRKVYGLPATGGGSGIIAIVDAYDFPTALGDFNVFAKTFSLPLETSTNSTASTNKVFQVVYASGKKPAQNGSWNQEAALDIEWAHAMAPNAKIVLVEAASSSTKDLFAAVAIANKISGVREVSLSWGSAEYSGEKAYDSSMLQSGVVYFASSGDTGGIVTYPGCSPNVVSCGGTSLIIDAYGNFYSETGWSGSGGGKSVYETRPVYQNGISALASTSRAMPDLSFDADPNSGVAVYDSTAYNGISGWMVYGGTSVSAPALAGIVNTASTSRGSFSASTAAELNLIYNNLKTANFRDITVGTAGTFSCAVGWDFVTGAGSSLGLVGK